MPSIELFGRKVEAGQSARFRAPVSELNDGTIVTVPIMVHCGRRDGPTVLLSGAIHGDEYNGPSSIPTLFSTLSADDVKGVLIGVPIMNPFSYFTKERVASLDYEHMNLNRIWPGDPAGFLSQRLAHTLFTEIAMKAQAIIDFHEGGIAFIADYLIMSGTASTKQKVGAKQREMAVWFGDGMPVLEGTISEEAAKIGRAGALSEAAGARGIPVCGVEIGGAGTVWPQMVKRAVAGTRRILQGLELLDGIPDLGGKPQIFCPTSAWPRPSHGGLLRPLPAATIHNTVKARTPLADLLDPFGEVLETLVAPFDCVILDTRFIATVYPGDWTYHCGALH